MFEFITETEKRGQVGIGTLIVFIAMVLVAAIAAGVLVNTAGVLQATAEDAGKQSVDKVTNRVEVLNSHGTVGASGEIDNVTLTIRLAAGSSSVDMNETSIKYLSSENVATLNNDSAEEGADTGSFVLDEITDDDSSFGVLNSMSDRYTVEISTAAIEADDDAVTSDSDAGLDTGDRLQLEITSRNGGTTQVILTMPQQTAGKEQGDPVQL